MDPAVPPDSTTGGRALSQTRGSWMPSPWWSVCNLPHSSCRELMEKGYVVFTDEGLESSESSLDKFVYVKFTSPLSFTPALTISTETWLCNSLSVGSCKKKKCNSVLTTGCYNTGVLFFFKYIFYVRNPDFLLGLYSGFGI